MAVGCAAGHVVMDVSRASGRDGEGTERRLAAVLAADVAGYSRLIGVDEEGTLAALKAHRREVFNPKIAEHHGRIVKTIGDGMLVEFASAVDAVRCAFEIQQTMTERNEDTSDDRRIDFRVGINVGDIVIDEGDIFGDGVNVAARLESIAERGGVCVSRQVLDQIEGKVPVVCRELGRQNLKNIARPVEVYAISLNDAGPPGSTFLATANLHQKIKYCNAADNVRLAYATVGAGPPLMSRRIGSVILSMIGSFRFTGITCLGWQRITRWSGMTRVVTGCPIGTSVAFRWTRG